MGKVEVSEEVYELLLAVARRRGRGVDEVILECIAKDVDPSVRVKVYVQTSREIL